jgi:hypothetical protein
MFAGVPKAGRLHQRPIAAAALTWKILPLDQRIRNHPPPRATVGLPPAVCVISVELRRPDGGHLTRFTVAQIDGNRAMS